jgi:hypothetical protein
MSVICDDTAPADLNIQGNGSKSPRCKICRHRLSRHHAGLHVSQILKGEIAMLPLKLRHATPLAIFTIAAAVAAFPGLCKAAAYWTDLGQVSDLNQQPATGAQPGIVLLNVSTTSNPSGCSVANGYYLSITDDRTTRLFTMLMMAQAT